MNAEEQWAAKQQVLAAFDRGWCSVRELLRAETVPLHRATAYRVRQRDDADPQAARTMGITAARTSCGARFRTWQQESWQSPPGCRSQTVQNALDERFALRRSTAHRNLVRASLGLSRRRGDVKKSAHALV
jgi:hypothetical protein